MKTDIVFIDGTCGTPSQVSAPSPPQRASGGKTSFLLDKFRALLSSGADASRILVLCPLAVKERFIETALSGGGSGELHIDSFSAFAKWALKKNSPQFTNSFSFTIISGKEEEVILKEILSENIPGLKKFSSLRNFRGFISEAVDFIDSHKIDPSGKLGPDEFALISEYDKRLKERNLFDLRDVERLCLESVSAGVFSSSFDHIFLDGWEDLNPRECAIFMKLAEKSEGLKGLYIAGDDSRGIYDFLGGDAEGTGKALEEKFGSHRIDMSAGPVPQYELLKFMSGYDNARWILTEIKKLIDSGVSPADIAVIARDTGDEIKLLEDMASSEGLPLGCPSGAPFFKHPQFLAFLSFLYFTVGIDEQVSFADMLALPVFNLSDSDIFRFLEGDHRRKKAPAEAVERVRKAAKKALASLSSGNTARIKKLYCFCGSAQLAGDDIVLNRLFGKFFEYAEKFDSITSDLDFEKFLALLSGSLSTFARAPYLEDVPGTAKLLTVHEAKGAHFKFVFIAGALWGKFPRRFSPGVFIKKTEDEQKHYDTEEKIFRVALTSGTQKVFVTFVAGEEDDEIPSPYIEEFFKGVAVRALPSQELFSAALEMRAAEDISPSAKSAPLFSDAGGQRPRISVSALESYMKCPLKFFIEKMIVIETKKSEALNCGLIVHSILEKFHAEFPQPQDRKEMALRMGELIDEFFSPPYADDFETLHSASCWKAFFSVFLTKYAAEDNDFKVIEREKDIVVPVGDFDIRGRIDRVDQTSGGFGIIDYKTSTGKKFKETSLRNQIGRGEHLALPIYARAVEGCSAISLFWLADYKEPDKYPQKVTLFLKDAELESELASLSEKLKGMVKSSKEGKELTKKINKLKTVYKGVSATLDALDEMDAKMKDALKNLKKADFSPGEKCGISRNCSYKYLCDRVGGTDIYES